MIRRLWKVKKLKKIDISKLLINKNIKIFRCPICKNSMVLIDNSLMCKNKHCFNISKKGYVSLLNKNTKTIYDKELFESRNQIYKGKLYDKLTKEIIKIVDEYTLSEKNYVLDTGCGEGYFLNKLYFEETISKKCELVGIDIAKEGISIATRDENNIIWSVSDLSNLPFNDSKFDVILNILSPANYKEFNRVLDKDGVVIKVIPEDNYLQEIRKQLKGNIKNNSYSNKNIVEVFNENLNIIYEKRISYKTNINSSNLNHLIKMTPLTSSLNECKVNSLLELNISEITIDLKIIVGRMKK
jgi:23S rRNA (guanine745-N1)-methyltransferase